MKKIRILCTLLIIALLISSCAGSKKPAEQPNPEDEVYSDVEQEEQSEIPIIETGFINPLTGERTLEKEEQTKLRPVAVSVNNLISAQRVQTGLEEADIIYESYVEGGITRLLAVYKDISKIAEIGTVRSARYNYVDLACGDDALFVHAGVDYDFCQPHIKQLGLDSKNMLENSYYKYAYRIKNGLALEHTLYTTGENIAKMIADHGIRSTVNETHAGNWQNFKETASPLPGGAATKITAAFSGSYISSFQYDPTSDKYIKQNHNDKNSGNPLSVKNVVVLFTDTGYFDNQGYRVNISLNGGTGYYFSNGTYQQINWKKGGTYDRLVLTDESGAPLAYNPGSSWVCIVNNNMRSKFVME